MTTPIEREAKEKEIYVVDNHKSKGSFQITSLEYLIQQNSYLPLYLHTRSYALSIDLINV